MIISSRNLRPHLPTLTYPAALLSEKGDRKLADLTRPQLEKLIAAGSVVGIGSRTRIKSLRAILAVEVDPYRGDGPQWHYRENLGDCKVIPMLKRIDPKSGSTRRWDHSLTFEQLRQGK